jgi:alanyl-tRNA synthetase
MSEVVKGKRNKSKLEAQHLAIQIRMEIKTELMASFAYSEKRFEKHVQQVTSHIKDGDEREAAVQQIRELEGRFDVWFIAEERRAVHDLTREISHHIRAANTIFPSNIDPDVQKAEYVQRRTEWNAALEACNKLQDELQYIAEVLPADKNKYMRIVLEVEHLFNTIKSLRQSDNKRFFPGK